MTTTNAEIKKRRSQKGFIFMKLLTNWAFLIVHSAASSEKNFRQRKSRKYSRLLTILPLKKKTPLAVLPTQRTAKAEPPIKKYSPTDIIPFSVEL